MINVRQILQFFYKCTLAIQSSLTLSSLDRYAYQGVHSPEYRAGSIQQNLAGLKAFITNTAVLQSPGVRTYDSPEIRIGTYQRPLKVMIVGLRGFPDVQGGIETHVEHLAPLLVKLGCDVEVLVRTPYQNKTVGKTWCGVRFTSLWAPKSKGLEAICHTFLGVLYAAIKRPDILHIHAIGPALLTPFARMLGLRVVVTHHGPDYDRQKWGGFAKFVLKAGEWCGMRFSSGRIVISNVIKDLVLKKHAMHSELIVNGVVLPEMHQDSNLIEQFGLQPNRYILIVGRLVPEKRHLDLIKAFNQANLQGTKLVIVGSSDHPDEYMKRVISESAMNKQIVMTGFQTGDALRCLYSHAALFVLPSSHEGLSISLLEALSYGLPVIASNIPANKELRLNSACYFPLGDIDALCAQLKKNIHEPVSAGTCLDRRNWVGRHFNWHDIADKTYREYCSLFG